MKAIISSTYSDTYLFYLPITTWLWNRLGVDVICFMPYTEDRIDTVKYLTALDYMRHKALSYHGHMFDAPKHKEATYAQCSRLYAACLDLPEDEVLITSDIDMGVFKIPPHEEMFWNALVILGGDLVPRGQYPMCYASGTVNDWREVMQIKGRTYQQCLDDLLGDIECENMRGNYWGKDQETLFDKANETAIVIPRARPGTQFASNRYDRDDAFLLDRLSPDTIDFHMNRPGYETDNFNTILSVLRYHYPDEDFRWLIDFKDDYKKLIYI